MKPLNWTRNSTFVKLQNESTHDWLHTELLSALQKETCRIRWGHSDFIVCWKRLQPALTVRSPDRQPEAPIQPFDLIGETERQEDESSWLFTHFYAVVDGIFIQHEVVNERY
jgi:hypothetical protein